MADTKLHYLESFGRPIHVLYQPSPARWAASALELKSRRATDDFALSEVQALSIEMNNTCCGLGLKFDVEHDGNVQQRYAVLGGIISIDRTIYGMTAAHTFVTTVQKDSEIPDADIDDENGQTVSEYGRDVVLDAETQSSPLKSLSIALNKNNKTVYQRYHGFDTHKTYPFLNAYSCRNRVVGIDGVLRTDKDANADWALFPISDNYLLPNMNATMPLLEICHESQLGCGDVTILFTSNSSCVGFLTSPSIFSNGEEISVSDRDIVSKFPLPEGISGCWVVRQHQLCGYIVAVDLSGNSSYMIPMGQAFKDIESIFGSSISFGQPLNDDIQKLREGYQLSRVIGDARLALNGAQKSRNRGWNSMNTEYVHRITQQIEKYIENLRPRHASGVFREGEFNEYAYSIGASWMSLASLSRRGNSSIFSEVSVMINADFDNSEVTPHDFDQDLFSSQIYRKTYPSKTEP